MMETRYYREKDSTLADRAIDGLFGGLAGGALMGVVMALLGLLVGETPAGILERFNAGQGATPLAGALMHLAVSAVYGVGFSLLVMLIPRRRREKIPGWLAGLAYAALLLVLAASVILPGARSTLADLPLWVFGLGHAAYGLVLGEWAYPKDRKNPRKTV